MRGERLDLLPDATKELATATPLLSMCRAALKHPTVEPAFRTLQEKPPEQLQLKSLPSSITRFLYLHEVEGLLGQGRGSPRSRAGSLSVFRGRVRMQQPFASFRRGRAQPDTQNAELIGVRLMPWGAVQAVTDTHSHSFKLGNLSYGSTGGKRCALELDTSVIRG